MIKKVTKKQKIPEKRLPFFITHFRKLLVGILVGYALLYILSHLFFHSFLNPSLVRELDTKTALKILPQFLLSVGTTFVIGIYLFNSWLAHKWLRLEPSKVILAR